ncbi:hypothetical protein QQ045_029745 [Rhodiola kirilowii]
MLGSLGHGRVLDNMGGVSDGAKFDCLLFDMDDTLYPMSLGINMACRLNIQDESDVPKMCLDLYREHGTTMAGLKALGYEFDDDEFHAYVHGRLPYDKLKPDPVLRSLLISMPQRKIIFTNADQTHVAKVLKKMGLEDCFEGVICFETLNPACKNGNKILCKPSVEAMKAVIKIANVDDANRICSKYCKWKGSTGLSTVLVGSSGPAEGADFVLMSIHNMKEAIPEIWSILSKDEEEHVEQMVHLQLQASAVEPVQA